MSARETLEKWLEEERGWTDVRVHTRRNAIREVLEENDALVAEVRRLEAKLKLSATAREILAEHNLVICQASLHHAERERCGTKKGKSE